MRLGQLDERQANPALDELHLLKRPFHGNGIGFHEQVPMQPGEPEMVIEQQPERSDDFDDILDNWFALAYVLNSLNRSVGMPDPYPFTLSTPVIDKLRFIHNVVRARRGANETANA